LTPKQQKVPFPAMVSVWLLAAMSGMNLALAEWFMAGGFALLGLLLLALIHLSETAT
jgi:hypothetical protein